MRSNSPLLLHGPSAHVACEIHANLAITHFCCLPTCLMPLCSKCIKDHNQFHKNEGTYSEIELLEDIKDHCASLVKSNISKYSYEIEKLYIQSKGKSLDNDEGLMKIKKSKKIILDIIESYYHDLEESYIKKVQMDNYDNDLKEIPLYIDKLRKIIDSLNKLYISFESKDIVYSIKSTLARDFDEEFKLIKSEINKGDGNPNNKMHPFSVNFDDHKLKNIYQILEQIIHITHHYDSVSSIKVNSKLIANKNQITPFKHSNNCFRVTASDYFDPNVYKRYLHFFQHKSKTLHLFDLDLLEQQKICEFEKIDLNIDFKIPRWHRSIVTPFSEIYITGGVDVDNSLLKLKNSYVYDFNNKTLIDICSMNVGRSGHAMVYLNGFLYALGGFSDEKIYTDKCERYNIRKNIWEQISSMKIGSNNPCACTFKSKYIYKFGGKIDDNQLCNIIERYNPIIDKWNIIEFDIPKELAQHDDFLILSSSACIQINSNEIFIFGGTYVDYSNKSNQSYLLSIEEKDEDSRGIITIENKKNYEGNYNISHKIKGINEFPLPIAEGFWNNQVVVHNKKLVCLQNVANEKNNTVAYLDRRKVLEFDSEDGWRILN